MKGELPLLVIVEHPPAGVLFRVQRGKSELLAPSESRKDALTFDFTIRVEGEPPNFLGEFAQGPKAARFIYVNSGQYAGQRETPWARRAKLTLMGISAALVKRALNGKTKGLEVRIDGTANDGGPVCASVPVTWRIR